MTEPDWIDLPAVPESVLRSDIRARLLGGEGSPPPAPPWSTGIGDLMTNLAQRGLLATAR